jgi:hypothetical protein
MDILAAPESKIKRRPSESEALGSGPVYETPRHITDIKDCFFYHTIDLPVFGVQESRFFSKPNSAS